MGFYCSRRDTTKTQAQMKMKRRILHMDTICLTSLRILQPFNFENCSLIAKVLSHFAIDRPKFALRDFKSCTPTEKRIC